MTVASMRMNRLPSLNASKFSTKVAHPVRLPPPERTQIAVLRTRATQSEPADAAIKLQRNRNYQSDVIRTLQKLEAASSKVPTSVTVKDEYPRHVDDLLRQHYDAHVYPHVAKYAQDFNARGLVTGVSILPEALRRFCRARSVIALKLVGKQRGSINSVTQELRNSSRSIAYWDVSQHVKACRYIHVSPVALDLHSAIAGNRISPLPEEFEGDNFVIASFGNPEEALRMHTDVQQYTVATTLQHLPKNSGGEVTCIMLPNEAYGLKPDLHTGLSREEIRTIDPRELPEVLKRYDRPENRLIVPSRKNLDYILDGARVPHQVSAPNRHFKLPQSRISFIESFHPENDRRSIGEVRAVHEIEFRESYPEVGRSNDN